MRASPLHTSHTLHTVADIRQYFAQRQQATYFISPSNFNMLDMHRWVRGWKNINLLDCFDGAHPDVLVIPDDHARVFTSCEDINHYLLQHPLAREAIRSRSHIPDAAPDQALFLFFDAELERICREELQLEVALPPNKLVRHVDSKIVTTEIGNRAGVASVPNIMARVESYAQLQQLARQAQLGEKLVVQAAYGDSGKTTWFIANADEFDAVADQITAQDMVKIMRRVRCTGTAIEACATRWGTFVGPLLTELIGAPALTPYPGGWCGNELFEEAFSAEQRQEVLRKTQAIGQELYQLGYRGYFELDYLIDQDDGTLYLGELNPRMTGVSAITNMSAFCQAEIPLFLFHLLEYDPHVDLALDVAAFNQSLCTQGAAGVSAQLILKYTPDRLTVVTQAPLSGVYRLQSDGTLALVQPGFDRLQAQAPDEAYVLRIMPQGEYAYHGADLAILFINQVVRTPEGLLNAAGQGWASALKECFQFRNLSAQERTQVEQAHHPVHIKGAP